LLCILTAFLCLHDGSSPAFSADVDEQINPIPRALKTSSMRVWSFAKSADGWAAEQNCTLAHVQERLVVQSLNDDPYFHCPVDIPGGRFLLRMEAKSQTGGDGAVYWTTRTSPRGEHNRANFPLLHDGKWRVVEVQFEAPGQLTDLRIDPGGARGLFEVRRIELLRAVQHPLTIDRVEQSGQDVVFRLRNHSGQPTTFQRDGTTHWIAAGATRDFRHRLEGKRPLELVSTVIEFDGFPPLERQVMVHNPLLETDWIERDLGNNRRLKLARDGTLGRIVEGQKLLAVIGPIVQRKGVIPKLRLLDESGSITFEGDNLRLALTVEGSEIHVSIRGEEELTGPVVRTAGSLRQGVLAGVEYLGKGESSSSRLDIETDAHLRFRPDPLDVTMPLMAFATDRASIDLTWDDMSLRPLFAAPNFLDGTDGQLMALSGRGIEATIRIHSGAIEDSILWAIRKHGLPDLPKPPRSTAEQNQLCLKALNGPLRTKAGWGHCVEQRWARRPYADIASTYWRLSGQVPTFDRFVPGGSHVANDAIYFVTGHADEWLRMRTAHIRSLLAAQRADGSFRYAGKFRRGHFEDTASGICALPASQLLEFAHFTGDQDALAAGLKTLEYMKRFRTPRGAQTWEVPLHTPDQLASAYLVRSYVYGYQLTGDASYLVEARRWAISGLPFVYMWGKFPIMAYATPPVLGATNWQAPLWIGLPVQWVGGVYAHSLALLSPHDETLPWSKIAQGILHTAEQMQFPDGENVGLLPDAFMLDGQKRLPAMINPSALVSLRRVLQGEVDSLAVARSKEWVVISPFPLKIVDRTARISGVRGTEYQVLINGKAVKIESQGDDVITLNDDSR
jgi:hypothetical protein